MRDKDILIRRCLSISICIISLLIPIVVTGKRERQIVQNDDNDVIKEPEEDSRIIQVDEKRYQEITEKFFDVVEHAVAEMTFEEVFGENR